MNPTAPRPTAPLAWARRGPAPLLGLSLAMLLLSVFFALGLFVDDRIIAGAPAWLKPLKFGISIAVYSATLLWMLGLVRRGPRWKGRLVSAASWVVVLVFVAEMVPITLQVLRGTTSHFNVATPLDAALWSLMGVAIVVLWTTNLVLAGLLLVERIEPPALAWGVRLGLLIALVGMAEGFLMTDPTAQQLAGFRAGAPVSIVGAHSVGVPDGGPGLPLLGWSTQGGDLRVGHFVGMHALQVLPLLGWALGRRRRGPARGAVRRVAVAAAGYLGLTLLLTWQALRAQPLLRPDALTLAAAAGLALAVAIGWALAGRSAPRSRPLAARAAR